jgi:cytochrome c5
MPNRGLFIAVAASLCLAASGAQSRDDLTLRSVNVELPAGDRSFPSGPGSEVVSNNCLACHSVEMVLSQPALSKAQWTSEVGKMRETYKAPIELADVSTIVSYLVSLKEKK